MAGWFYNDVSGAVNRVPTALEAPYLIPGSGWHELLISYNATRAQALAEAAKEFPSSAAPGAPLATNAANSPAATTALNATGITAIGDFFHRLTESQTWVRVGEVAVGGILLYAGVRALASGSTVNRGVRNASSTVTKPARKTAKAAVRVAAPEARLATRKVAKKAAPKTTAVIAQHRAEVRRYGRKTPYSAPAPRPPTQRVSHVYYHSSKAKP